MSFCYAEFVAKKPNFEDGAHVYDVSFPVFKIPNMNNDYVISSVKNAKLNEREIEVMELYPDYQ